MERDINKPSEENFNGREIKTVNSDAKIVNAAGTQKLEQYNDLVPYDKLPYDDPAIVNPQELASFPPPARKVGKEEIENENEERNVSLKKSAVRDKRNITRTDTSGDIEGGYM